MPTCEDCMTHPVHQSFNGAWFRNNFNKNSNTNNYIIYKNTTIKIVRRNKK